MLRSFLIAAFVAGGAFLLYSRHSGPVSVAPDFRIGVDIGGTKCLVALYARTEQTPLAEVRVPTGVDFGIADVEQALSKFLTTQSALLRDKRVQCGVSVPGLVDASGTLVFIPDVKGLEGWQPRQFAPLRAVCGSSIGVANDIEAAAAALPARLRDRSVVVLVVGTGIGAFYLDRGKPVLGQAGFTGEFGLAPIPQFHAGPGDVQTTTWDNELSGRAILRHISRDMQRKTSAKEIVAALASDQESRLSTLAKKEIRRAGQVLGMAIATHINQFNPDAVFVGGGAFRWPGYEAAAREAAAKHALPTMWKTAELVVSENPGHLPALGASMLLLSKFGE